MSRILIRGNRVLTLQEGDDCIRNGAVIVSDGIIEAVGSHEELSKKGPFEEELGSLEEDVVIPGLVSAHHHAGNNLRDGLDDRPLETWVPLIFGSYRVGMTEEETYLRSLWSALELQRCGVTTVVDFHAPSMNLPEWGFAPCIQAYLDAGIRVSFGVSTRDQNAFVYGDHTEFLNGLPKEQKKWAEGAMAVPDLDEYFKIVENIYGEFNGKDDLVRIFITPLGVQWTSDDLLNRAKRKAGELKTGLQIHVVESRYQMMYGPKHLGTSTIGHLNDIGFLGPEVSFAHCIWPSREDIQILVDTETAITHNPTQNVKLASGIAPIWTMREMGLRFAFGTDGSSFNDDNDLWTELRLGWFLARPPSIDWENISAKEWFTRCIQEGNRIAMQDNLGSLEPGKIADITVLSGKKIFDDPASYPDYDPWTLLLHRAHGTRDIHTVLTKGEIVVRDGKSVRVDSEDIGRKLAGILESRHAKLKQDKPFFDPILQGIRSYFHEMEVETEVRNPELYRYNQI